MSTEQSTSDTWGAPRQPSPGRWSGKRIVIAIAVAVGIAGAGATAVYAASDSADSGGTSAQGGPGGTGGPPDGGGMDGGGMGGGPGALSQALHGEYVVSDGNGGYTTELLQNGEVTAISDTSVTVESEDGYTKTYTVDADLSDIATGDDVTVTADESGTAATVVEAGQMGQGQPPGN